MRKSDKAALAKTLLIGLAPDELPATVTYFVDGGSLLHRVKWTKKHLIRTNNAAVCYICKEQW
jgi:hypothetical protein